MVILPATGHRRWWLSVIGHQISASPPCVPRCLPATCTRGCPHNCHGEGCGSVSCVACQLREGVDGSATSRFHAIWGSSAPTHDGVLPDSLPPHPPAKSRFFGLGSMELVCVGLVMRARCCLDDCSRSLGAPKLLFPSFFQSWYADLCILGHLASFAGILSSWG